MLLLVLRLQAGDQRFDAFRPFLEVGGVADSGSVRSRRVPSESVCGASRVGVNRRSSCGLTPTASLFVLP